AGADLRGAGHGLVRRARVTSTTVPGAASVPPGGCWSMTVPGSPDGLVRAKDVPIVSPACSSLVRASSNVRPASAGTVIVGAPRLTTRVTRAAGDIAEPAEGRVFTVTPLGAEVWVDSTAAVSPADSTSSRAKLPS